MHFLLRFKGPIQSWGDSSKHLTKGSYRGTTECPTMSGVIGLINCCFGINSTNNKEQYNSLISKIKHVSTYSKENYHILKDFQTMGGGYDTNNEVSRKNGKRKIDRSVGVGFEQSGKTVGSLSTREYLEDSDFFMVLDVEDSISEEFKQNLIRPKWQPTLGRSSCIPSCKIFVDCDKSEEEYLETIKDKFQSDEIIKYSPSRPNTQHKTLTIFDIPTDRFRNVQRTIYKSFV